MIRASDNGGNNITAPGRRGLEPEGRALQGRMSSPTAADNMAALSASHPASATNMEVKPAHNSKKMTKGAMKTDEEEDVKLKATEEFHLQLDPSLFMLSKEERDSAVNVKESIECLPDLDNLSDFMYVNLSMMGDVNWAVDRAYKMQEVREEYNILLTYEDGVRSIEAMVDLLPLVWMSYTFNLQTGSSVMVLDSTKYRTSLWKNPRNIEIMVKGGFYAMYATHPCLEVVRKGKVDIMECEGYQYGAGMADLAQSAHFTSLSVGAFPSNVITKFYHTPVMANVFISMWKKLIPKDIASKIEVGCQYPGGRLDQFYMLPSPEAATKRVLKNFRKGLKVRMESEKLFSLDQSMGND